ncbi:MAG: hypothetical protein M0019_08265 [Actinomycetota bacterium]|nr:hypothetical protein [Actinomycetota bacterium]
MNSELTVRSVAREINSARRAHFFDVNDKLTVVVKGYFIVAIVGIIVDLITNSSVLIKIDKPFIASFIRYIPTITLLIYTAALSVGLSAGSKGGPITVFRSEMRLVFLAGTDHPELLRRKYLKLIFLRSYISILVGVVVGALLYHLNNGYKLLPAVAMAIIAYTASNIYIGASVVGNLTRIRTEFVYLITIVLAVAVYISTVIGNVSAIASLGGVSLFAVSRFPTEALIVPILALAAVVAGFMLVARFELEPIERRSELISKLRFAVALRDIRGVISLSRALGDGGYTPRRLPGLLMNVTMRPRRSAIYLSCSNFYNWRLRRYIRLVLTVSVAVYAIDLSIAKATVDGLIGIPFVVLAGLEMSDTVGSLVDHPNQFINYPVEDGWLLSRSLLFPMVALLILASGINLIIFAATHLVAIEVSAPIIATMAISATFAGGFAHYRGSKGSSASMITMVPEAAAFAYLLDALPVVFANSWIIAVINTKSAMTHLQVPYSEAISTSSFLLVVPLAIWAYISNGRVVRAE